MSLANSSNFGDALPSIGTSANAVPNICNIPPRTSPIINAFALDAADLIHSNPTLIAFGTIHMAFQIILSHPPINVARLPSVSPAALNHSPVLENCIPNQDFISGHNCSLIPMPILSIKPVIPRSDISFNHFFVDPGQIQSAICDPIYRPSAPAAATSMPFNPNFRIFPKNLLPTFAKLPINGIFFVILLNTSLAICANNNLTTILKPPETISSIVRFEPNISSIICAD